MSWSTWRAPCARRTQQWCGDQQSVTMSRRARRNGVKSSAYSVTASAVGSVDAASARRMRLLPRGAALRLGGGASKIPPAETKRRAEIQNHRREAPSPDVSGAVPRVTCAGRRHTAQPLASNRADAGLGAAIRCVGGSAVHVEHVKVPQTRRCCRGIAGRRTAGASSGSPAIPIQRGIVQRRHVKEERGKGVHQLPCRRAEQQNFAQVLHIATARGLERQADTVNRHRQVGQAQLSRVDPFPTRPSPSPQHIIPMPPVPPPPSAACKTGAIQMGVSHVEAKTEPRCPPKKTYTHRTHTCRPPPATRTAPRSRPGCIAPPAREIQRNGPCDWHA